MRIAIVSNTSWYLFNFRLSLMRALTAAGHTVVAVAPLDDYSGKIRAAGFSFEAVSISGAGVNPAAELKSVLALLAAFRRLRVDLALSYTPKGNLYSALACMVIGLKFVPNVSGLGRAFIKQSLLTRIGRLMYRLTFRHAHHVFFQNNDDLTTFVNAGWVLARRASRVPGSGVDLKRFSPRDHVDTRSSEAPVFLLVARMLWDKGIGEYVSAARSVRKRYPQARFKLLGFLSVDNPSAVSNNQVDAWVAEGVIEYLGATDDVRPHLAVADCVVLPSYREGVPRTLLEAAAMARPVVTTDAPGCRDTVIDGVSGFLCQPRDAVDLTHKLLAFIALRPHVRQSMGLRGREYMEAKFSERIVLDRYLQCVNELSGAPRK